MPGQAFSKAFAVDSWENHILFTGESSRFFRSFGDRIICCLAGTETMPPAVKESDMGGQSRAHKEKRERKVDGSKKNRAGEMEEESRKLEDGDAVFWASEDCPADLREFNLEDILAFESVGSGDSPFEEVRQHGMRLPNPEDLDWQQGAAKADGITLALADLQILLVGLEGMSARQFYWTLWRISLWERHTIKTPNRNAMDAASLLRRNQKAPRRITRHRRKNTKSLPALRFKPSSSRESEKR